MEIAGALFYLAPFVIIALVIGVTYIVVKSQKKKKQPPYFTEGKSRILSKKTDPEFSRDAMAAKSSSDSSSSSSYD